jgi:hypothetical protein
MEDIFYNHSSGRSIGSYPADDEFAVPEIANITMRNIYSYKST